MTEDEHGIGYEVLPKGTPVIAADGEQVGTVHRVQDNLREHIFDGIVISTSDGRRFVDAPEVERITNKRVLLTITAAEAAELPPPEKGAPEFQANVKAGRIGRMFGGGWKRR